MKVVSELLAMDLMEGILRDAELILQFIEADMKAFPKITLEADLRLAKTNVEVIKRRIALIQECAFEAFPSFETENNKENIA